MTHSGTRSGRAPVRWGRWISAACGVLFLSAGGLLAAINLTPDEAPLKTISSSTQEPTATPVVQSFYAEAVFPGWEASAETDGGARFSVNGDLVRSGAGALRIDSDAPADSPHGSLRQTVWVEPQTSYDFSVWVMSEHSEENTTVTVALDGGTTSSTSLPVGARTWTEVQWTFITGDGQTALQLDVTPSGPTTGFLIDDLYAAPSAGGEGIVANGSFDDFLAPSVIANPALILETGNADIEIEWFARSVDWSVARYAGDEVEAGTLALVGGVGAIPLDALGQGYYNLTVQSEGADPATALSTAFMVLDSTSPLADDRFGVAAHVDVGSYKNSQIVAEMLGIRGVRTDARWGAVELQTGEYTFPDAYEESFNAFEQAGITVLPGSSGRTPLYENNRIPSTPSGIQAYANYTAALVSHYSSPAVEIFNELNNPPFNNSTCGLTASCYLPILKTSYETVKAASPDTLVVAPANANQDDPWLTELYQAGGLEYLDVVSYHPYVVEPEMLIPDIRQAQNRIKEYNNGIAKPIWLTEFGWTATSGDESEFVQANNLARSEMIAFANGVEKTFWYDLINDQTDRTDHEGNFGLFRQVSETVHAFEPKPAAMTQAMLIRMIGGKMFAADESIDTAVYAYVFGTGTESTRAVWSTAESSVSYSSKVPLTITTSYGEVRVVEPVDGNVVVAIGEAPVYVDGAVRAGVLG